MRTIGKVLVTFAMSPGILVGLVVALVIAGMAVGFALVEQLFDALD